MAKDIKWLRKIRIAHRLLLISIVYMLPIGALLYYAVQGFQKDINFATQEVRGNEYLRPLQDIVSVMSQHRLLVKEALLHVDGAMDKIGPLEVKVNHAIDSIKSADRVHGSALLFTREGLQQRKRDGFDSQGLGDKMSSLLSNWKTFSPEDADKAHVDIITHAKTMIAHAGDTSNLILDPDLDSYYLMDTILAAIPATIEKVGEVGSILSDAAAKRNLSEDQRTRLTVLQALLSEVDLARIQGNIQVALAEDANFYDESPTLRQEIVGPSVKYQELLERLAKTIASITKEGSPDSEIAKNGVSQAFELLETVSSLGLKTGGELGTLLKIRITSVEGAKWKALVSALFLLVPTLILVYLVSRSIARPLNSIMNGLSKTTGHVQKVAQEIINSREALSHSSSDQAAAVQETVASMAEMTSMISQTVDYAKDSLGLAQRVTERTEDGGRIMERMVSAMESIQQANEQLQDMANIINEISVKTAVINDIVFKTQLLSFNASIEAARAGQHGRGFAVVAEEVGNLAETSGNAAKEIQILLENSRKQVQAIVEGTRTRVGEGQRVSTEALTTFNEIAKDVYGISSQIQSINDATREQEAGIKQTSIAMTQMDRTSQSNNVIASQASKFAEELTVDAKMLGEINAAMKLLIFGTGKAAREAHSGAADGEVSSIEDTEIIELTEDMFEEAKSMKASARRLADKYGQRKANKAISEPSQTRVTATDNSFQPME